MEWQDFIRYFASIVLTILGTIALAFEFRHPRTRQVTRAGIAMIFTIVICGCIVILSQIIADANDRRDRAKREQEQERDRERMSSLQEQLTRANYPLGTIRTVYILRIAGSNPELASYADRVKRAMGSSFGHILSNHSERDRLGVAGGGESDESVNKSSRSLRQYFLCPGSPLFPQEPIEPSLFDLVSRDTIEVEVYKNPSDVAHHPWVVGYTEAQRQPIAADLQFSIDKPRVSTPDCSICGCVDLSFEPDSAEIRLQGYADAPVDSLRTSGRVTSIADLRAAKMLVMTTPDYGATIHGLRVGLDRFSLKIGALDAMQLPLVRRENPHGRLYYEFSFPIKFDDLLKLTKPTSVVLR